MKGKHTTRKISTNTNTHTMLECVQASCTQSSKSWKVCVSLIFTWVISWVMFCNLCLGLSLHSCLTLASLHQWVGGQKDLFQYPTNELHKMGTALAQGCLWYMQEGVQEVPCESCNPPNYCNLCTSRSRELETRWVISVKPNGRCVP